MEHLATLEYQRKPDGERTYLGLAVSHVKAAATEQRPTNSYILMKDTLTKGLLH